MRSAPRHHDSQDRPPRDRSGPRILRALDNVPDDDLRAFSRVFNRVCWTFAAAGMVALAVVLLTGQG
jgi:hypothetical protein